MSYIYNPFSRRSFIQGLGGFVAAPFLASLAPKQAMAEMANAKRFVAIHTPNQGPPPMLAPAGYGKSVPSALTSLISNQSDGIYPYRQMNLANAAAAMDGSFSGLLDSKYNPYLSRMAVLRGLDMPGRVDHGSSTALGNIAGSHLGSERNYKPMRTMDEFLVYSNNFYSNGKVAYRFPILRMGETVISTNQVDGTQGLGIAANNASLTLNGNLKNIFDFGFMNQTGGQAKASLVDTIRDSVNSIQSQGKIGKDDKLVLAQFMDLMNDLQKGLVNAVIPPPKPSTSFADIGGQSIGELANGYALTKTFYQDMGRLITLALQCGLTKVVTVGVDSAVVDSTRVVTQGGSIRDWHLSLAHGDDRVALLAANKFITDNVFFEVMRGLDTLESGVGNYLDNTLMYYKSECSFGHSGENFSALIAGNSNGGLALGNMYDYSNWSHGLASQDTAPGQPINRLWIGMLHSLGLTPLDYQNKFGNGAKGFGVWEDNYPVGWEANFGAVLRGAKVADSLAGLFSK